tara:strand:- start:173 stop:427 length:255 start_codon:yes stop_codon:yes gene_type:complete
MQDQNTLIKLGFKHNKDWDSKHVDTKSYVLTLNNKTFRAHCYDESQGFKGINKFVTIGIITNNNKVDRWRDMCSEGSINRFINN